MFFLDLIYILLLKLKKYSILHGNVAMVARVFSKVLLFEKNFYNICKDSKKPLPSLPYCHKMRLLNYFLKEEKQDALRTSNKTN